jgi:hypothetical protein
MLCNLVQLDLNAMEAYDLAMVRVAEAGRREQPEAFKGVTSAARKSCRRSSPRWGKVSSGPETKENITTTGAVLADMDKRILEALKANEDDTNKAYERALEMSRVQPSAEPVCAPDRKTNAGTAPGSRSNSPPPKEQGRWPCIRGVDQRQERGKQIW